MREGALDPLFGQRAAFPLSDDLEVNKYLESVRFEAQALAKVPVKRAALDYGEPVKKRHEMLRAEISTEDASLIRDFTATLVSVKAPTSFSDFFKIAHDSYSELDSVRPEECTSLATWKAYCSANEPLPLDQTDVFRVYKYLIRWNFANERFFRWCWALLLRTPYVLTGDEIAVLRQLTRAIPENAWSRAWLVVVSEVYGQRDLPDQRRVSAAKATAEREA